MPKYTVLAQQYVEQTAKIEVEANSAEEAARMVRDAPYSRYYYKANWGPGDDIIKEDVYGVLDDTGELVWER